MSVVRVTKEFSFEMAHVLGGYDGLCNQIHGHSYRFFVTVKGSPLHESGNPKDGMVMDFGLLKRIVSESILDRYDHALMIRREERNEQLMGVLAVDGFDRIVKVDFQPTCENMVTEFAAIIRESLPAGITLQTVRLHETATSYAEWMDEDNE